MDSPIAPVLAPAGFVRIEPCTTGLALDFLDTSRTAVLSLTGYSMDGLDDGTNTQVHLLTVSRYLG